MGQGYFHQDDKSKKWSVQFCYKDYYGNNRRKHKRVFATKREAKQFMDEFIMILCMFTKIGRFLEFIENVGDFISEHRIAFIIGGIVCAGLVIGILWAATG